MIAVFCIANVLARLNGSKTTLVVTRLLQFLEAAPVTARIIHFNDVLFQRLVQFKSEDRAELRDNR